MKHLTFACLLTIVVGTAWADARQDIIDRCRETMGKYGASMVKACVDQDMEAMSALSKYPEKHSTIIARCRTQMERYGWNMVKACADQDIEAEEALSRY
jgi:SepF-like predicted cell division protein (DUF552 family)